MREGKSNLEGGWASGPVNKGQVGSATMLITKGQGTGRRGAPRYCHVVVHLAGGRWGLTPHRTASRQASQGHNAVKPKRADKALRGNGGTGAAALVWLARSKQRVTLIIAVVTGPSWNYRTDSLNVKIYSVTNFT